MASIIFQLFSFHILSLQKLFPPFKLSLVPGVFILIFSIIYTLGPLVRSGHAATHKHVVAYYLFMVVVPSTHYFIFGLIYLLFIV